MASSQNKMQKVTLADPSLTDVQRELMSKENLKQLQKYKSKFKSRTGLYGVALGTMVVGIYGYTIYTMSKDDFIADIESEVQKRS